MKLKNILNEGYIEEDFISTADVLKAYPKINKYEGYEDSMSGTLEWFKKGQDEMIFATPSWDGHAGITWIDYSDGYDPKNWAKLDFTKNKKIAGDKKLQMKIYVDAIRKATQKVDKIVQKKGK